MSVRECLLRGDVVLEHVAPFSHDEFAVYLQSAENRDVLPVPDMHGGEDDGPLR